MKNLSVRFAKLVGTPTNSSWSQIHTFIPEDSEKRFKRGTLLVVFTFSGFHEESEMAAIGKEIISRLHEEYYGNTDVSAMNCLSRTVKTVSAEFNGENSMVDIVGGVILEDVLYLAISANGQVWIKRGNTVQKVLQGKYLPNEVTSSSGFIKPNDLLVLGTKQFFSLLPEGVFRASLENGNPDEIVEAITPIVYGKEESSQVAALVGLVQADNEEAAEITEEAPGPAYIESVATGDQSLHENKLLAGLRVIGGLLIRTINYLRPILGKINLGKEGWQKPKNKRVFLSVALVLVSVFIFSLFMIKKSETDKKLLATYQVTYDEVKRNLDEGRAIADLNPSQSKELLTRAKDGVQRLTELKIEKIKTEEISRQVDEAIILTVKEYRLSDLETFFDMGLIREGGKGEKISMAKDTLLVLDQSAGRVYGVDLVKKSGEVVAGSGLPTNLELLTGSGNFAYCLGKEGISRTDLGNRNTEIVLKFDTDWKKINGLKSFLGNLYLLDSGAKNIWRYVATEAGFAAKTGWIQGAKDVAIDEISSFAVDGTIWMVDQNGKIFRFIAGAANLFNPKNLEKPLTGGAIIYSTEEMQNLYILDKGNNRLVIIRKSGEYGGQYLSEELSNIADFVVREDLKKMFLLQGNKIFQVDLH